ncbi:MAG: DUF1127 domain-containing protein [Rhodobacteraceae bacterium]|nr:DUF1127 domain-containing protein [Paracoccaceae bacterium]
MSPALATQHLTETLPPLSRLVVGFGLTLAAWELRRTTRTHLAQMDPHILRDIGLTPDQARSEAAKPFWRG